MQPMRLCTRFGGQLEKKTHPGEKSFKFNQCDFASLHSDDLRRHLKTHTGEKLYKCNQCNYASVILGNLRRHLKTHSVEKSFICNQCDFTSLHLDDLRKHLKTHTGKVIEMQPKRLCICFGTQFEKIFENLLWKKVFKMQSM